MDSKKMSIKLLIDTKKSKVLFAKSGKDFVDFLFFLMRLPMGTVIQLLTQNLMVGSIGNIYTSIENLNKTYLQPNQTKDLLLKPKLRFSDLKFQALLSLDGSYESDKKYYYQCATHTYFVSDKFGEMCPLCSTLMNKNMQHVQGTNNGKGGFVNGVVNYMVMDDLVVEPITSAICGINILNNFDVKDRGSLREEVVYLDMAQGLKLLKSSLETKNVLTTVFLGELGMNG